MKYTVPQHIDVEDKIIGPITVRQFIILIATAGVIFITYRILLFTPFIVAALIEFAIGGTFAFFRVNAQPFHYFLLNLLQTSKRPMTRAWNKNLNDAELYDIIRRPPPLPPKARIKKEEMAATKLSELSLIVNTGGVYNPED